MKLNRFLRLATATAAIVPMLWWGGCSNDPEVDPVEPSLEVNVEQVTVTRRGVDQNGNYAYIRVASNVYWQAYYPEEDKAWLTLSLMGGDPGTQTVTLEFTPNESEEERSTVVRLETLSGLKRSVTVIQRGLGDVVILLNDGFSGSYNEGVDISEYFPVEVEGLDYQNIAYEGENATLSAENPSMGYEGATGGNHVVLAGKDAWLSMTGVDTRRSQHFDITFGVYSAEGFTEEELVLEMSRDNELWANVPYTVSLPAESAAARTRSEIPAGWQMGMASFSIPRAVDQLWLRWRAVGEKTFALDDLSINEGSESAPVIEFAKPAVDPDGPQPVVKVLWEEHFDAFTPDLKTTDGKNLTGFFDDPSAITNSPDTRIDKLGENTPLWEATGITSQGGLVYVHAGNIKLGTNSGVGDIVLPAIQTLTGPTDLTISFRATKTKEDRVGLYKVTLEGDGTVVEKEFTVENFAYPKGATPHDTEEERANYQTVTLHVEGATAATRVRITASAVASQIIMDDFVIEGEVLEELPLEGLPVVWSLPMPEEAYAQGLLDPAVEKTDNGYKMGSQAVEYMLSDDKTARFQPVQATHSSTVGTYKVEAGKNIRFIMSGLAKDDAWLFTVPVKNLRAGTQLKFVTELSASAGGPKYFLLEYSVNEGADWTPVCTRTEMTEPTADAQGLTAHEVTYSLKMVMPANDPSPLEAVFTVAEALKEGNFLLRLRVCDDINNQCKAVIVAGGGGTNRIRRSIDASGAYTSPATSISVYNGTEPDDPTPPTPPADEDTLTVEGAAETLASAEEPQTRTITVASTGSDWKIESSAKWLKIEPAAGKAGEPVAVTVTPEVNAGAAREAEVTVTAGKAEPVKFTVKQIAAPAAIPTPKGTILWEEHFDAFTVDTFGETLSDFFAKPDAITNSPDVRIDKLGDHTDLWTATGITSEGGLVYAHIGNIKIGTAKAAGDIILPAIASLTEPTDVTVTLRAVHSSDGYKYNVIVKEGEGTAEPAEVEVVNAPYPAGAASYYERANYQVVSFKVKGATAATRIQIKAAAEAKSQLIIDDLSISTEANAPKVEGFPATWSFPVLEEALAGGQVSCDASGSYKNVERPAYLSDDKAASMIAVRTASAYSLNCTYKEETGKNIRFLMSGAKAGDYWQFSVPVKNFAAGTKLKLATYTQSSASGPGFFLLEYSVDGEQWTAVNTQTDDTGDYTISLLNKGGEQVAIEETFTVAEAVTDGTIHVRMRICRNVAANGKAIGDSGTTRISRAINADNTYAVDATTISIVE